MARELLRGYLQLAAGLGELTRSRAVELAGGLLDLDSMGSATGKVTDAVTGLADELMSASSINRKAVSELVRREVESVVSRLGLVSAADLEEAKQQVRRLQSEVAQLTRGRPRGTAAAATEDDGGEQTGSAKDRGAKKSAAKKVLRQATKKAAAASASVPGPVDLAQPGDADGPGHRGGRPAGTAATGSPAAPPATRTAAARRRTPTSKRSARKPSAPAAGEPVAKKSVARKSVAKKSVANRSSAQKSSATKRSAAKKSTSAPTAADETAGTTTADTRGDGSGVDQITVPDGRSSGSKLSQTRPDSLDGSDGSGRSPDVDGVDADSLHSGTAADSDGST